MRTSPRASGRAGMRGRRDARVTGADAERGRDPSPRGRPRRQTRRRCACCARRRRARAGAARPRSRSATCGGRCSSRPTTSRGAARARRGASCRRATTTWRPSTARGRSVVAASSAPRCSSPNRGEEAVAALTRAIDALPDEERELGLHLQAIRGAASQTDLKAAALARQAGLPLQPARPASRRTPGERMFDRRPRLPRGDDRHARKARELALQALPLLDDPGPGVPAVYGAPLALLFSGALVEATEAFTQDHRVGAAARLVPGLRPGLAPARGRVVAARQPRRGRGGRRSTPPSTRASWSARARSR